MKYEPFLVYVSFKGKELSGFGVNSENPQSCAKRLVFEAFNIKLDFVEAISANERIAVSSVNPSIASSWISTIKTIPVYRFKA